MRILTLGNLYPPHHFGGYEQVWQSAVDHLRSRGDNARVLATSFRHPGVPDDPEPSVFRELRWYWRDHDFARVGRRERVSVEHHNHKALAYHIDALQPDVVAVWSMGGMSHSLIEDVRRRGLPMVAFVHDQWLDYGRFTDQWTRQFLGRGRHASKLVEKATGLPTTVSYAEAGRYVFVSEFIRRKALQLPLGLSQTAVAHSGIDPSFLEADAATRDPAWGRRLLHVGRLHPDKGIEDAVRALMLLPPDTTLSFAGTWDGRDEAALATLVGELGLESRVTMLGHCDPSRVRTLLREHDALLFPVRWDEPWGLVPIEAMAAGCPVIATGRGGSGEYLRSNDNCLLVPAENPQAIAAAVEMLENDARLRAQLRAGGARTAPAHTTTVFNHEVARHLDEVAAR